MGSRGVVISPFVLPSVENGKKLDDCRVREKGVRDSEYNPKIVEPL